MRTLAVHQPSSSSNVVQLSRALGHHSAAFTLDVYAHLLDGEDAPPLDLSVVLSESIRLRPVAERTQRCATTSRGRVAQRPTARSSCQSGGAA